MNNSGNIIRRDRAHHPAQTTFVFLSTTLERRILQRVGHSYKVISLFPSKSRTIVIQVDGHQSSFTGFGFFSSIFERCRIRQYESPSTRPSRKALYGFPPLVMMIG